MSESANSDTQAGHETTVDSIIDGSASASSSTAMALMQVAGGGAAVGALSGATLLAGLVAVTPGAPMAGALPAGLLFGAPFGAFCGALLAPPVGYWLFRSTPLWRLYAYGALGTVFGGLLAGVVRIDPITGAFVGLAAGLMALRVQHSSRG